VGVSDESLYTEDRVPPVDRVLTLRGVLGEGLIKQIRQKMRATLRSTEPKLPENERKILRSTVDDFLALDQLKFPIYAAVSFGYADIPLGKRFGAVFKRSKPAEGALTQCVLQGVVNEWIPIAMDGIPHGHRSICLFDFMQGVPALIKRLPTVSPQTVVKPEDEVCLSSVETWELWKSKA
jgi:hypothetical protein